MPLVAQSRAVLVRQSAVARVLVQARQAMQRQDQQMRAQRQAQRQVQRLTRQRLLRQALVQRQVVAIVQSLVPQVQQPGMVQRFQPD